MKHLIIILFLCTLLLHADEHEAHERYEHHHISKELSHLDLSAKQYAKLKRILSRYRTDLKRYRHFKTLVEAQRDTLFLQDELNSKALNTLLLELDTRAREIEIDFIRQIHALLTPRQRKAFIYYFDDWEVE